MKTMETKTKLIFDGKSLPFILEALGFKTKKGLVVDAKTNELPNGEKIKAKKIIAITKNKKTGAPKFCTTVFDLHDDDKHLFI